MTGPTDEGPGLEPPGRLPRCSGCASASPLDGAIGRPDEVILALAEVLGSPVDFESTVRVRL